MTVALKQGTSQGSRTAPGARKGRLLANIPVLVLGAMVWTAFSAGLSWYVWDWQWFQRSGAILLVSGALLTARAIVLEGRAGAMPASTLVRATILDSYYDETGRLMYKIQKDAETIARERAQRINAFAAVVGLVLVLTGTLIDGYGDLIGRLRSSPMVVQSGHIRAGVDRVRLGNSRVLGRIAGVRGRVHGDGFRAPRLAASSWAEPQ